MVKDRLKSNNLHIKQHLERIWNAPNRFDDDNLTVTNVLYQNNNSSTMSVITVDNTLTRHSDTKVKDANSLIKTCTKLPVKPKKRKKKVFNKSFE